MTRYASSDIVSHHNVECPKGGHARTLTNQREVTKDGAEPKYKEPRLVIDCPVCEPLLQARDSWGDSESSAPLTAQEQAEADARAREANAIMGELSTSIAAAARDQMAQRRSAN